MTSAGRSVQPPRRTPDRHLVGEQATASATRPALPTLRVASLTGHTRAVQALTFDPGGRLLATAGRDGTVIVWDVVDPARPVRTATHTVDHHRRRGVRCAVQFTPSGRLLAAGRAIGQPRVRLWDLTERAHPVRLATLDLGGMRTRLRQCQMRFSPDGRLLATAGRDGGVTVWHLSDPARPSRSVTLDVGSGWGPLSASALGFSPDGRWLATGSTVRAEDRGFAELWNVSDPAHPRLATTLDLRADVIRAVRFSADRRLLAVCRLLVGDVSVIGSITLFTSAEVSEASVWDVSDPRHPIRTATLAHRRAGKKRPSNDPRVLDVAFSGDGSLLATGGADKTVALWDLTDPTRPAWTVTLAHHGPVGVVGFSPDGRLLASGSRNTVTLWHGP
jgi:WD40 repeat protein